MATKVVILYWENFEPEDSNIAKLVGFSGLETSVLYLDRKSVGIDYLRIGIDDSNPCIVSSCRTLHEIAKCYRYADDLRSFLCEEISYLFVYGAFPCSWVNSIIGYLTDQLVYSLSRFENNRHHYEFSDKHKGICREFSGLSFGPINSKIDSKFEMREENAAVRELISINRCPYFISVMRGVCNLFLVANKNIANINSGVKEVNELNDFYSQIIPALLFIRFVFQDMCWHRIENYASFILDDPLLQENYGFLNYKSLLNSMDEHGFSTVIAFIPFNHRRTDKKVASLFRSRSDKLTVCVHGCNHTQNEFGKTDYEELSRLIKLATERMKNHETITGVKFDRVMVFPQGVFSSQAMKMLKCNNYLGVVNSEVLTKNGKSELKMSDFFKPAIMKYENFPLFVRRYPGQLVDFAFDMFLGKAVFIVEHHDCFRYGYGRIESFIRKLNSIKPLKWDGVGNAITNNYLEKRGLDGNIYVKTYTKKTIIRNTSNKLMKYIISKEEIGNISIKGVMVGGKRISYQIDGGLLMVSIDIKPKEVAIIEILYQDGVPNIVNRESIKQNIKIHMRRYLSELRDNFLCKNRLLLKIFNIIKEKIN